MYIQHVLWFPGHALKISWLTLKHVEWTWLLAHDTCVVGNGACFMACKTYSRGDDDDDEADDDDV